MSREVVLVGACRTPVGTFGGTLKDTPVVELGRVVMEESIKELASADVLMKLFGCVLTAAQGQTRPGSP